MSQKKKMKFTKLRVQRELFAQQVSTLLNKHRFSWTWGAPAHCFDGVAEVYICRAEKIGGAVQQLVTVSTAVLPTAVARGLRWSVREVGNDSSVGRISRVGSTNGRGQFHLRDLPPGRYCLQMEAPTSQAAWTELRSEFIARLPLAAERAELPFQEPIRFGSSNGVNCEVEPDPTATGQVVLRVAIQHKASKHGVAYLKLWSQGGQLIERGFVGLSLTDTSTHTCTGETVLQVPDEPLYLEVGPQTRPIPFSSRNRADLKRSLDRSRVRPGQRILGRRLKEMDAAVHLVLERMEASRELVKSVWSYEEKDESRIRAFLVYLTSGHALGFHRAIFLELCRNKLVYRHGIGQIERSAFASVGEQVEKLEFAVQLRRALNSPDWGHHDGLHQRMQEPPYSIVADDFEHLSWWRNQNGKLVPSDVGATDSWIARLRQRINARSFLICPVCIHGEPQGVVIVDRRWDRPDSLTKQDLCRFESFVQHAELLMEESGGQHHQASIHRELWKPATAAVSQLKGDLDSLRNEINDFPAAGALVSKMAGTLKQLENLIEQCRSGVCQKHHERSSGRQLAETLLRLIGDSVVGELEPVTGRAT